MDTMPIDVPRQAGLYVRRSREAQGLTRAQLACAAGVSERSLASLELGDATGIRLDKLLAVLEALGLSLAVQGENIAASSGTARKNGSVNGLEKARSLAVPKVSPHMEEQASPGGLSHKASAGLLREHNSLLREIARQQGIELAGEAR